MLQKEFEERTGYTVDTITYNDIEQMYMESNLDKDEFCKEWKKYNESKLLDFFFKRYIETTRQYKATVEAQSAREAEILAIQEEKNEELAHFLIHKAHELSDSDLHFEAVGLIGNVKVIRYEIENNLPLTQSDLDYIKENLK